MVLAMRDLKSALRQGGKPPVKTRTLPSGQVVVDVFPAGLDHLCFPGQRGEVWVEPGKPATQGSKMNERRTDGGEVCLVLAAGNHILLAAGDILHKLVVENAVVACKLSVVNEAGGPVLEKMFAPLVDRGYLRFLYGGAEEGKVLVEHPLVQTLHLTGSSATHDAIVWGPGRPKGTGPPANPRPISSELGCVSPMIVCPGQWSEGDLDFHAKNIVSGLVQNSSHNCLAPEVLVTSRAWPQREAFLDRVRYHMRTASARAAYYPGSAAKHAAYKAAMPNAEELTLPEAIQALEATGDGTYGGGPAPPVVPWTLSAGNTPEAAAAVTSRENWCGMFTEVALDGPADPDSFLPAATAFANDKCWGTLSCGIFVHPGTRRRHRAAVDRAIADLRYGSIAVNAPNIPAFATARMPWGGHPGHTLADVGSGLGWVHNTAMVDHAMKGVLYIPWRPTPYPWWFYDHRNLESFVRRANHHFAKPSLLRLIPVAAAALLG